MYACDVEYYYNLQDTHRDSGKPRHGLGGPGGGGSIVSDVSQ